MYENGQDFSPVTDSGADNSLWVTKSLWDMSQISHQNDYDMMMQSEARRSSLAQQERALMEQKTNRMTQDILNGTYNPVDYGFSANGNNAGSNDNAALQRQYDLESNQRMAQLQQDVQQWNNGYIGSLMAGGNYAMNYLATAPWPVLGGGNSASNADQSSSFNTSDLQSSFDGMKNLLNNYDWDNNTFNNDLQVNGSNSLRDVQIQQFTDLLNTFTDMLNRFNGKTGDLTGSIDTENLREQRDYSDLAAEGLNMIFTPEVISNWESLTVNERADRAGAYVEYLCRTFGIAIYEVEFSDMGSGTFGSMDASNNKMNINLRMLENPERLGKMLDTITHEARHQLQYEAAFTDKEFNVDAGTAKEWKENWLNYIKSEDDPEGYRKQSIEADAFGFAANVMKKANTGLNVDRSSLK